VNLIAGPYTPSDAHEDQGSLMIYKDGWLAYDVVVKQETTAHSWCGSPAAASRCPE
jgi:hypothetical protein